MVQRVSDDERAELSRPQLRSHCRLALTAATITLLGFIKCSNRLKQKSAFTLLELLLTISVVAAIAAVSIPQIGLLLGDRRLVRSGEIIRIEMTRLRVDAMRQGQTMMLQAMIDGNTLQMKPFVSVVDAIETNRNSGSQSGLLMGADQASAVAFPQSDTEARTIELPESISITAVNVLSTARSLDIQNQAVDTLTSELSQPILFYADGTTSTASVKLSHLDGTSIAVGLRGITGDVTIGEVSR